VRKLKIKSTSLSDLEKVAGGGDKSHPNVVEECSYLRIPCSNQINSTWSCIS